MRHRLLPVIAVAVLAACSSDGGGSEPATDATAATGASVRRVTVAFQDASVPPAFHRSWELTADPATLRITVTSYGTPVNQAQAPMPDGLWAQVLSGRPLADGPDVATPAGCVGGTSVRVRFEPGGAEPAERSIGRCGGSGAAEMDAVLAWITPVRDALGDWATLAREGVEPDTLGSAPTTAG